MKTDNNKLAHIFAFVSSVFLVAVIIYLLTYKQPKECKHGVSVSDLPEQLPFEKKFLALQDSGRQTIDFDFEEGNLLINVLQATPQREIAVTINPQNMKSGDVRYCAVRLPEGYTIGWFTCYLYVGENSYYGSTGDWLYKQNGSQIERSAEQQAVYNRATLDGKAYLLYKFTYFSNDLKFFEEIKLF